MNQSCPLCESLQVRIYQEPPYFTCENCKLLFKDSTIRLNEENEKSRYLLHKNSTDDLHYVNFLMPVVDEVSRHFNSNSKGLDYGSGPQPVLQELLKRNNIFTDVYDPYFAPRNLNENGAYDFITCTETAEHFYNPSFEFEKIFHLLKPNGYLFLMTKLFTPELEIKKWDYARDTSHVCFYSMQSLEWICKKYSRKLSVVTPRFFILN